MSGKILSSKEFEHALDFLAHQGEVGARPAHGIRAAGLKTDADCAHLGKHVRLKN